MNTKAIRNARSLGYLVATADSAAEREEWRRIAIEDGFPFVVVSIDLRKANGGVSGRISVGWETSHLWPAVSQQAKAHAETVKALHADVEVRMITPECGAIGSLALDDAKRLASRIIGLTGYQGAAA